MKNIITIYLRLESMKKRLVVFLNSCSVFHISPGLEKTALKQCIQYDFPSYDRSYYRLTPEFSLAHTTEKPLKHFHDKTVLCWWWDNKAAQFIIPKMHTEHSIHLMIFTELVPTRFDPGNWKIYLHDDHEMIKIAFFAT